MCTQMQRRRSIEQLAGQQHWHVHVALHECNVRARLPLTHTRRRSEATRYSAAQASGCASFLQGDARKPQQLSHQSWGAERWWLQKAPTATHRMPCAPGRRLAKMARKRSREVRGAAAPRGHGVPPRRRRRCAPARHATLVPRTAPMAQRPSGPTYPGARNTRPQGQLCRMTLRAVGAENPRARGALS